MPKNIREHGAPVPVGEVLRTTAQELCGLGRLASDLQSVLSPSEPWAAQDGAAVRRLQSLDALTQSLHAVSDFLHALAPMLPPHWSCDAERAAEVVTLSDLAQRLGRGVRATSPVPADEAGELELFGG